MKNRHMFSNVQTAFARNWKLLTHFERDQDTDGAVNALLSMIPKSATIFRVHESGDFHSQWAIDVWTEVAKKRKDVWFWAYTRSFDFNFYKLSKSVNFMLWASTDSFNEKDAIRFVRKYRRSGVKHAWGPWEHDLNLPGKSFVCPATNKKMALEGACERCMLCVTKKRTGKHVVFMAH